MPEQTIDQREVERTRQYIRQLVAEINQLSGADIPPQQFFGEFLQRVVNAVAAVGGAVWSRDGQQPPRLQHQVNFLNSGLLDEARGAGGHSALLMNSFSNGHAKLIPPQSGAGAAAEREAGANSSDWALLLSPLQVDKHTLGVVELLMDPNRRQTALDNAVRFVQELCDIGAGYLKNRQLRQMLGQQHLWSQLEMFVRQIHSSLNPKEVAYIVANEGKRMVGCDRLSVALVYGKKAVIEGVSGQEVIERKSTLIQLMTHLCNTVLQSGENLLYTGEQRDDLPPAVRDSLDDYLAESGTKILAVTLLRTVDKEGTQGKPIGTLIGEQLEDATAPDSLTPRMEVVGQHGAIALENALSHHRVFMLPVWSFVGNTTEWMRGNRLTKLGIALGGIAAIVAAMVYVPLELRMEGKGVLVPASRHNLYAPENAIVNNVGIEHGEIVQTGQSLLGMISPELEQQMKTLQMQLEDAQNRFNTARASSNPQSARDSGAQSTLAEAEMKILSQQVEALQERLNLLEIKSPCEGMIAKPWDPQQTLGSRPVKQGEMLLIVSQVDGSDWILEVKMPEHKIGHIWDAEKRRRERNDPNPLPARFILASHPQKEFKGHVQRIETTAEFDKDENAHVVTIRIVPEGVANVRAEKISLDETAGTPARQQVSFVVLEFENGEKLQLSPGAEVRAKVECGKRPMGYVILRELIEFVYETILF